MMIRDVSICGHRKANVYIYIHTYIYIYIIIYIYIYIHAYFFIFSGTPYDRINFPGIVARHKDDQLVLGELM